MRLSTLWRPLALPLLVALFAVSAQAQTFSNPAFIAAPAQATTSGPAGTYPSTQTLAGRTGTVTDLDVRINGLMHTSPSDLGLLLVSPGGQNIVLMSGDGGATDVAGVALTFNDAAAAGALPTPLVTGSYRPKGGTASPPAPAPAPSGSAALSVFNGIDPNGAWTLYAFDTATGNFGSFVGGWSLLVTTTTTAQFTQTLSTAIQVPALVTAAGAGDPYPSTITVSGASTIVDLNVTLSSLTHSFPGDFRVVLVGPAGQNLVLIAGNGGGTDIGGVMLTLDDEAATAVGTGAFTTGSFRPRGGTTTQPAPAPVPTGSTALTVFDGTDPNGVWSLYVSDGAGGDVGAFSGGWSLTLGVPVPPGLALSQSSLNLPAAGPCVLGASPINATDVISVSNVGTSGNVTVTGGTFSGPNASSFSFSTAPAFPISINAGAAAVPLTVLFAPPTGATGPQNATLTLSFTVDGGATQTRDIPLSGTSDARGAGFVFRGSLSDPACSNGAALPSTTAFIDIAGQTAIVGLSTDDAAVAYTIPAGFGPFRMFGIDYTTLQVSSNGLVAPGTTALGGAFYGFPRPSGLNAIQVMAGDRDMTTATYDATDPGTYAPGVYAGLADGDADGAADDLVITWYHAYNFGSPNYAAATPSTAQYLTAQLVLIQAPRANEEDIVEVRFIDGVEAGSGIPYRLNTTVVGPASNPFSIEGRFTTAVSEALGAESALYRTGGAGGPVYDGSGNVGVRFQAEAQAAATGQAGWRMLGAPVRTYTVGRLAGVNLVQSVTNQYPTFPSDNLFTGYNGSAYVAAVSTADVLTPGRGFLWYLFNQNLVPNPANDGGGTSVSYTLPMRLEGTGAEPAVASGGVAVALTTTGNKFNLVANPYRDDISVATLGTWVTGGALASNVPQVWDPNVGGSGSYVAVTGSLSAWQGFFVENNTATGLLVPTNVRDEAGPFLGRDGSLYANVASATLAFELAGTDAATGLATVDRAATLAVRAEEATDGWDVWDASKLSPLAAAYATLAFQGERDGQPRLKAQESRALDAASFEVPLVVDAVGTAPSLTLSWAGLDALPDTWALELRDVVTGTTVDLRTVPSYTFEQDAAAVTVTAPEALVARTTTGAQAKAADAPRFVLVVTTRGVVASEPGVPTVFALAAPAPNPTASSATVSFDVPAATDVSVAVYDLLGRRVAVLAEGAVAAGRHTARLEAGTLAPGVYVVRMTAGSFAATQRVTVVR